MNFSQNKAILICSISIPISLLLWLCNSAILKFFPTPEDSYISPSRCLFSTAAPVILMIIALSRQSVDISGALLGVIFAFILSISNYAFFASLVAFFFSSSRATKFKADIKQKIQADFKEGEGQRNWIQVLCNGGIAVQLALLYIIDCGFSERPINFNLDYRASWLSVAVLSSFSCCSGDTWASELGCVLSKSDPFLITSWKRVPRGTNGGISALGLLFSFLGGLFIGLFYFVTVCYTVNTKTLNNSPPQWPLILIGGIAGLLGSMLDSVIGATLQYSGISKEGFIIDSPGKDVRHISGYSILNNNSVNLISSLITALYIPYVALKLWPEY